jgi:hypothetical protein
VSAVRTNASAAAARRSASPHAIQGARTIEARTIRDRSIEALTFRDRSIEARTIVSVHTIETDDRARERSRVLEGETT